MSEAFDLLVLAVSRVKHGVALAGMTTEPHPVTGRVWVDIVRPDGPLQRDDLLLPDGALMRPGDVLHCEGLTQQPAEPPFVERWVYGPEASMRLARHITPERYARFMPDHLDRDPAAVLQRGERSLALVRTNEVNALFELDQRRFKSYMLFAVAELGSYDVPVVDLAWRALGRRWLQEDQATEMALEADDMYARFGSLYLVIGVYRGSRLLVRGVHAVPALDTPIELEQL